MRDDDEDAVNDELYDLWGRDRGERTDARGGYGEESYAPAQTEYEGELYRFCCSEHKEEFEADPERHL